MVLLQLNSMVVLLLMVYRGLSDMRFLSWHQHSIVGIGKTLIETQHFIIATCTSQ